MRRLLTLAIFAAASVAAQSQETVYKKVLSSVIAPVLSSTVPQVGQGLHVLTIVFPTATTTLSGLNVRMDGSYDNSNYFPITTDINDAIYTGAFAYAQVRGNGSFPYVKIRVLTAAGANSCGVGVPCPMDCWYTGSPHPIGNVYLATDRFLSTPTSGFDKATFVICNGEACAIATNITNRLVLTSDTTLERCWITAKTPPIGADLIVDILSNGTTSVFPAGGFHLTDGLTGPVSTATFIAPRQIAGNYFTVNITQVGSTQAGQDVTVACRMTF